LQESRHKRLIPDATLTGIGPQKHVAAREHDAGGKPPPPASVLGKPGVDVTDHRGKYCENQTDGTQATAQRSQVLPQLVHTSRLLPRMSDLTHVPDE